MQKTLRSQLFDKHAVAAGNQPLMLSASPDLANWLQTQKLSLALSTYEIGKLLLLGNNATGQLSVFERTYRRSMGLAATSNGFWLASEYQIWRFENSLPAGVKHNDYDRLYIPQAGYTTGDIDVHDLGITRTGRPVFAATAFNCLATLSETHSFKPLWKPPFITSFARGDRCHLNGIAIRDGQAAYVSCTGHSDEVDGWRQHRNNGGVIVDTASNEIIARGLSMPHSPRWHDNRLWLCNSGSGEFGHVDLPTGRFEPVTFCAGYMRGLSIHGHFAILGLSAPRSDALRGLPLEQALASSHTAPFCGIQIIDLRSGATVHWLRFDKLIHELYDVITLPDTQRPMALGFLNDEIKYTISIE